MTYQEIYDLYMKPYVEDAALTSRIEEGIEKNRKGDCRVRLVDADGKPLYQQTPHNPKKGKRKRR